MMGSLPPSGNDTSGALGLLAALGDPKKTQKLLQDINEKTSAAQQLHDAAKAANKEVDSKLEAHKKLLDQIERTNQDTSNKLSAISQAAAALEVKQKDLALREQTLAATKEQHAKEVASHQANAANRLAAIDGKEKVVDKIIAAKTAEAVAKTAAAQKEAEQNREITVRIRNEAEAVKKEVLALKEELRNKLNKFKDFAEQVGR